MKMIILFGVIMENKIIIVGGYCATGKSTFSRKLSKFLGIPCFNKDTIKEVLGDGIGSENNTISQKGNFTTFILMLHIIEQFLQAGKMCIVESDFVLKESEQIKALLEKYNYECLTYVFKGDFDVLYDRYVDRDKVEKRHWVHDITKETRENFKEGHLYFGCGEIGIGQVVEVDATSFEKVNYEKLFYIAKDFTK
jgi:predicted kinase